MPPPGRIHRVDGSAGTPVVNVGDHSAVPPCAHWAVPARRPRVLVALTPPLLADLVQRELPSAEFEVVVERPSRWTLRQWDVAVVPQQAVHAVRARHVVVAPARRSAPDFRGLVALIRRLAASTA